MARGPSHISAERDPTGPYYPPPQATADYAVPPLSEGAPVINPLGWAPKYIDPRNPMAPIDMRPPATQGPRDYWRGRDADDKRRHSVEDQDADGWTIRKDYRRLAPDARLTPPPEPRATGLMAPRSYSFTRPFDQFNRGDFGTVRQLNGVHFSMADHRRTYEIYGMAPPRHARNTSRSMPAPWDSDIVDLPPDSSPASLRVRSVEVPSPTRTYRL
jgi:hypothetical protein